ncbi:type II toxin-antitoxin system VapC family toxin [Glycomyces niveus]|uniref:Type II toxin-antitoxin system VapC family toxin n=1 Tax=Glycomyces niveus TaxID=2820287 RepID=A0ABS3U3N0_9ACTN|nr:type II toxin-antitoxin system VapC family toxin [Glycomyces sp. NEAU-S30]MBO3733380.1 type II toxin-antitoxin system VapC family toxin [Glycomyces sp. NEAU-S30]
MSEPVWTLVDSNIWLDVFGKGSEWKTWSEQALASVYDDGPVCINALIYAEISVRFEAVEDIEALLPPDLVVREPIPFSAAFLAGKAFKLYRQRGGAKYAPLPDFYIGAHAMVRGYRLLTRDAGRFNTYFPKLELISPE